MKTPRCTVREMEKKNKKLRIRADWKVKNEGKVWKEAQHRRWNERRLCVCVQFNVDVSERVKGRVGSFGLFSLAHLPGEAATNRKV